MGRRKSFFHVRKPSLRGRIAARTSLKRMIRARIRAPRGLGLLTNPKKAIYNRVYNRRTVSLFSLLARPLSSGRASTSGRAATETEPKATRPPSPQKTNGRFTMVMVAGLVGLVIIVSNLVMQGQSAKTDSDAPPSTSAASTPLASSPQVSSPDSTEAPAADDDSDRVEKEIAAYAATKGETSEQFAQSVRSGLDRIETFVASIEQNGGTAEGALDSLAGLSRALEDPEKIKLMECIGVQVYQDPQPPGHPPSAEECAAVLERAHIPAAPEPVSLPPAPLSRPVQEVQAEQPQSPPPTEPIEDTRTPAERHQYDSYICDHGDPDSAATTAACDRSDAPQ